MDTIRFEIPGRPVPLKRHRGRGKQMYDPNKGGKETFLAQCKHHRPDGPWAGPVGVTLDFFFQRPKKHYDKAGSLLDTAPDFNTNTPDVDNLVKFVMDTLNGIFWKDDCFIVHIRATKLYAYEPKTEIFMTRLKL